MNYTRLLVLGEDYGDSVLVATTCTNEQLDSILDKMLENDENGIGQSVEEICENLFPMEDMKEVCDTMSSEGLFINELTTKCVASKSYYSFGVVKGEE